MRASHCSRWLTASLLLLPILALRAAEPPVYSIQYVAPVEDRTNLQATVATAINNEGDIAGWARLDRFSPGESGFRSIDGVLEYFQPPADLYSTETMDINAGGIVVGYTWESYGDTRTFVFDDGGTADLGTLGGASAAAMGINDSGQVVGWSDTGGTSSLRRPFMYEAGEMYDLGGLRGASSPGTAYTINAAGVAAGESDGRAVIFRNGQVEDLALGLEAVGWTGFDDAQSVVLDLNDDEVGVGHVSNEPYHHRFPQPGFGVIYEEGEIFPMTDEHLDTTAVSVNNAGDVVGLVSAKNYTDTYSYLFRDGVLYHLPELLEPGSSALPSIVRSINDAGQIVGYSYENCEKAIVMTPTGGARTNTVATPQFSPVSGIFDSKNQQVTLTSDTPGATIRYTTGTLPVTDASTQYKRRLKVSSSTMLNARAFKPGMTPSPTATIILRKEYPAAQAPVFSPPPGEYEGTVLVTMKSPSKGTETRFQVSPDEAAYWPPAKRNQASILITESATITAASYPKGASSFRRSGEVTATYTIKPSNKTAPAPVISPAAGTYPWGTKIKITAKQRKATIFYSDERTLTEALPDYLYRRPFTLSQSPTGQIIVKAQTIVPGMNPSPVTTVTYEPIDKKGRR